jgi:chaperonin cofactor prefoldin
MKQRTEPTSLDGRYETLKQEKDPLGKQMEKMETEMADLQKRSSSRDIPDICLVTRTVR